MLGIFVCLYVCVYVCEKHLVGNAKGQLVRLPAKVVVR